MVRNLNLSRAVEMVQTYLNLAQHDLGASHHLASPVDNWGF
jgi:hypothetical protein